jgi:hypothetical protein
MLKIALALLPVLVRERAYLLGLVAKWSKLPVASSAKLDGDALIAMIRKYEPIAYELAKSGFSIAKAIALVMARTFTPHKMTRQEEETWFKRMSGNGEF